MNTVTSTTRTKTVVTSKVEKVSYSYQDPANTKFVIKVNEEFVVVGGFMRDTEKRRGFALFATDGGIKKFETMKSVREFVAANVVVTGDLTMPFIIEFSGDPIEVAEAPKAEQTEAEEIAELMGTTPEAIADMADHEPTIEELNQLLATGAINTKKSSRRRDKAAA